MSSEAKFITGIVIGSLLLITGAYFLVGIQQSSNIQKEQIITEDGLHWHPKLTITVKGKQQKIPANIGIGAVHAKIHTHDQDAKDGIIHMEMPETVTKEDTKLGNFFRVWGKEFGSTKILDKTSDEGEKIKMLVNGKENKSFENYLMKDKDKIEIIFE